MREAGKGRQTFDAATRHIYDPQPSEWTGRFELLLIGNGGAEYGVRGYVSAYDAATGKLAWRFYTTPNPKGAADGEGAGGSTPDAERIG